MDISGILRPEQLPFKVPPDLEYAINELLAAWERDEKLNLDCVTSMRCRLRQEASARRTMRGYGAIMFSMDGGRRTIDFLPLLRLLHS